MQKYLEAKLGCLQNASFFQKAYQKKPWLTSENMRTCRLWNVLLLGSQPFAELVRIPKLNFDFPHRYKPHTQP